MIVFSVIIPHYNSFAKLERLLESIPVQDKDLETIVIDDNSEDTGSYERVKARYPEVTFCKNTSGRKGAGAARNIGLKRAQGVWVIFADADDYFLKGAFERFRRYLRDPSDIIYFEPTSQNETTGRESCRHLPHKELIKKYLEGGDEGIRYLFREPWSRMIRRSFLSREGILFDEIILSNDINFSVRSGYFARKIKAVSEQVYCITKSSSSLTGNKSREAFLIRYNSNKRRNDFLKSKGLMRFQTPMLKTFILSKHKIGVPLRIRVLVEVVVRGDRLISPAYWEVVRSPKKFVPKIVEVMERKRIAREEKKPIS